MDGGEFELDAGPVFGKAAGYVEQLAGDDVSHSTDDREGEDAGDGDCKDARDAAGLEAADGGRQHKREREGEGKGDEKLAGKVQDQDGDREGEEGPNPGELGASSGRHTTSRSLMDRVGLSGQEYIKAVNAGALEGQRDAGFRGE
jgi:hypothetical protein